MARLHGERLDHREDVLDPVAELAREQLALLLTPLALGDVFDCQQDQLRASSLRAFKSMVRRPIGLEIVLDLEVGELLIRGQHLLQQPTQLRDVPLPVAELVERPALPFPRDRP